MIRRLLKEVRRARCGVLGHDPIVEWPTAHCSRCPATWGRLSTTVTTPLEER